MRKPMKHRARANHQIELQTLEAHKEKYRGKNVIVIGKEIFPVENGEQAARLLEELRKKYPTKSPLLTYVMGEETYILCL